jgi:hypothetical protein
LSKRYKKRTSKPSNQNGAKPKLFSRLSKGNWGIAIGGILMFVSWVSQNFYISELNAKIERLKTTAQFTSTEKGPALQWMLKYQEELRKKPIYDPEVIVNSAKGYASSMEKILEAISQASPQSTILLGHYKKITRCKEDIANAIKSHDVNTIITTSNELMQWAETAYKQALPELRTIEAKINSNYILWTRIFKFSYLAATCLFAISWVIVNGRCLLNLEQSSNEQAAQVGRPERPPVS